MKRLANVLVPIVAIMAWIVLPFLAAGVLLGRIPQASGTAYDIGAVVVLAAWLVLVVLMVIDAFSGDRLRPRMLAAIRRAVATDRPVRARRLPLVVGLPALVLLILVVLIVAIATRDAAWTAGTAAITTMIVLAYQGWQIQESTAVSAQAVVIGQAAAIEAEKRRLDSKAPRIRVSMDRPDWPPSGPRLRVGVDPVQVDEGRVYRLPKNGRDGVSFCAQGRVQNEGTQTVDVELRGVRRFVELPGVPSDTPGRSPWSEPGTFRQSLAPGATICFRLQGEATVEDWIANHRAVTQEVTGNEPLQRLAAVIEGEVVVDDGDDNGVRDTWSLQLTGRPLEPVPDEDGAWRIPSVLPEHLPISAWVSPRQRSYWRSKMHGHELPPAQA